MACNLCTLPVNATFRLAWCSLGVEQGHLRALPSYADEEAGSYSRRVLSPLLPPRWDAELVGPHGAQWSWEQPRR